jgi:uncharacterized membrane protein
VKLIDVLQGKWLGHPVHAAVVHVAVGGWIVACGLDVCARVGWGGALAMRVAWWCVGIGLAVTLIAVPTGIADWLAIKKGRPAWKLGLYHMLLNASATIVWTVNFLLRFAAHRDGTQTLPTSVLMTSIAGALLVMVSAYLGSLMVFDHGIGVARFSKKKWREIALRAGARVPEEK